MAPDHVRHESRIREAQFQEAHVQNSQVLVVTDERKAVCRSPQMHNRYHLACTALSKVTALLPALANKHQKGVLHNEVLEVMECGPGPKSP